MLNQQVVQSPHVSALSSPNIRTDKMKKMNFKAKQVILFLIVGIIPFAIIGITALRISSLALSDQVYKQLESIRDIKKNQIEQFFEERQGDLEVLIQSMGVFRREAINKLIAVRNIKKNRVERYISRIFLEMNIFAKSGDIRLLNKQLVEYHDVMDTKADGVYDVTTEEYKEIYDNFGSSLNWFVGDGNFSDIYILCAAHGHVMYSTAKKDDLGANMSSGPYQESGLAKLWAKVIDTKQNAIVDFNHYSPKENEIAAFAGVPLFNENNEIIGVVAVQITLDYINQIMAERSGLGETGETYLVGPDFLMRSDLLTDFNTHSVTASFKDPSKGKIETNSSKAALSGKTGADVITGHNGNPVISAYIPVIVEDLTWALIAEIDVAEAFCPKDESGQYFFEHYTQLYGYYDLFLINPDGYCFYSVKKTTAYQTNFLDGEYENSGLGKLVKQVLKTKNYAMVDFQPNASNNDEPAAFIAQPLLYNNETELIIALQLPLDSINRIMTQRQGMGTSGETYLVGEDFLMRSDSFLDQVNRTVKASFANPVNGKVETEAVKNAFAGKSGQQIMNDYNGNTVLSAYAPIKFADFNWALLAEIDTAEAFKSVNVMMGIIGIIALFVLAGIIMLAFFVAKSITNPISNIIGNLQSSSTELETIARQQTTAVTEQTTAISEVSTTTQEVVATAQQIAANTQAVSTGTQKIVSAGEAGRSAIQNTQIGMEKTRKQVQLIAEHMLELGKKSQQIGVILDIINELSEQTNLLALNAAIEAAGAGDAGKRFAVVADEVRKLAERSGESTKNIRKLVTTIQETANTTIMVTEDGTKAVDEGIHLFEEVADSLKLILNQLDHTFSASREIDMTTRQQTTSISQVADALNDISLAARQTEESSTQTLESVKILLDASRELQTMIDG